MLQNIFILNACPCFELSVHQEQTVDKYDTEDCSKPTQSGKINQSRNKVNA